jgi:hypothetical protein
MFYNHAKQPTLRGWSAFKIVSNISGLEVHKPSLHVFCPRRRYFTLGEYLLLYLNFVVFIYVRTSSIQITENVYDDDSAVKHQAAFDFYDDDSAVNPLKTNGRPLYLETQSFLRCKQFSSRL